MGKTGKGIVVCPSCQSRYKIPFEFEGKPAACKKCGDTFFLLFQTEPPKPSKEPGLANPLQPVDGDDEKPNSEIPAVEPPPAEAALPLEVTVSEDKMAAYITLAEPEASPITMETLKEFLSSKGVCFGLVSNADIIHILEELSEDSDPILIARGKSPTSGHPPEITYYFDTDPMKIGTLKQDGLMDFRDRGEVPQVKEGALLAMRSPGEPPQPGKDVLGVEIPCPKVKDVKISCGKGVKKSEDGLKAHALLDGEPALSPDGKLSVFPKLLIPGDVDLKTGHVKFDGAVDVRGSIRNDFRVESGRLTAGEILRSDINVAGDIAVSGGIIGATIRGDGNLKARYVHEARIHVLGDVVVEKEVIDSDIISSGAFLMERGKMFNSRISAKMGLTAGQIGSDGSRPCSLSVGIEEVVQQKIQALKEQRTDKNRKLGKFEKVVKRLRALSADLYQEITELAQVQDRGSLEQRALKEKIDEMKGTGQSEEASKLIDRDEVLSKEIHRADQRLAELMDQQENIQRKIAQLGDLTAQMESDMVQLTEDSRRINEWSQAAGGSSTVKVMKEIYSNTTIKAPNSSIRLKGNKKRSLIKEKEVRKQDSQELVWELVVAPLK